MSNLADIRGEVRELTDTSGSTFHQDYDLNRAINRSLGNLQQMVMNASDESYFAQTGSYDIALTTGTADYSISDLNPWKVISVSINDGSYDYICHQAPWSDRHDYQVSTPTPPYSNHYRYLLFGNTIKVIPSPPTGYTLKVWHVPSWADLSSDTDTPNSQIQEPWLQWVIYDVAIKVRLKTEEGIQELLVMKQEVERMIREDLESRITKQIKYAPDDSDHLPETWDRFTNR